MTGTYRFKTGFYGPTDMPTEIQKAIDYTLIGLENTFCFLDNILIVSKVSEEDHFKLKTSCLKKLDANNLRVNLPKCHFANQKILGLKYNITQSGISPIQNFRNSFTPTTQYTEKTSLFPWLCSL